MSMLVITGTLLEQSDKARKLAAPPAPMPIAAPWYEGVKRVLEFAAALFLLILTSPLMLFAMILIKLTSSGPVIYTQTRLGRGGKPFTIYKLRTMAHDCESLTGARWSTPGDTRVTRVGRWLRRTHIDELPQLWNVLKGEMSLIGPRPERPEFLPQLEQAIPHYRERLRFRPGVTGFAQVQLPPDTDFDSVRLKLAFDLFYVSRMSLLFDVKIYVATLLKLLGVSMATIAMVCRFPTRAALEPDYEKHSASR